MPRETIDLPRSVEWLQVLDEEGALDEEWMPDLDDEELLAWHRAMLLSRRFDERLLELQRQGKIGTFAPVRGQEASQIGAVAALEEEDWVVPSFRETAAAVWRGIPLEGLLLYNAGYNEGGEVPEGKHDLPIAIPVASQIPHAVGIAYGAAYEGSDEVVMVFFGDGATSEGDFHESINFAGVFGCPVVFVCQNNQWAISLPREEQTKSKTLAQKGLSAGIPGIQVDGNDPFAVYVAAGEAVERARSGEGPTLIECVTYRLSLHTTADDPSKYRDEEEVEEWEAKDPLPRLQGFLQERDLLDDGAIEELEEEVSGEIEAAWEAASERMAELDDPAVMFDHVWAERPPELERQRETLAKEWSRRDEGAGGEGEE
ncbi:MAG: pyruvate dehydrogenase (acetyl-transferring) E1 component subunit alpha [Gemmatimonadota bacterium]|nr:pyruvate dehydrogenase (acetyl-transferring) E1 component subunit alpha [Gemmatimonadota bacterium]